MWRVLRDALIEEKADALCRLIQQFRVSDPIEPAPGFYSRVLDEIVARQKSAWLPPMYTRFTFRLAAICVLLASLAMLLVVRNQRAILTDYRSAIAELTSTRPENRRDAALALILADATVPSQAR